MHHLNIYMSIRRCEELPVMHIETQNKQRISSALGSRLSQPIIHRKENVGVQEKKYASNFSSVSIRSSSET